MIKTTIALTTTLLILNGCGGGGTNTPLGQVEGDLYKDFRIQKVEYELNGKNTPICKNVGQQTGLEKSALRSTCTWICGDYQGASPIAVLLAFEREDANSVWQFEREHLSTASSACRK
ncbi:MAG: hypothetical protein L3J43_09660 [Sulfurovum sp.]|nr:hypothetical protein [Sulfurovum sp.]